MKAEEIRKMAVPQVAETNTPEVICLATACVFLREIAAQLAELNERMRGDSLFSVVVYHP